MSVSQYTEVLLGSGNISLCQECCQGSKTDTGDWQPTEESQGDDSRRSGLQSNTEESMRVKPEARDEEELEKEQLKGDVVTWQCPNVP